MRIANYLGLDCRGELLIFKSDIDPDLLLGFSITRESSAFGLDFNTLFVFEYTGSLALFGTTVDFPRLNWPIAFVALFCWDSLI